MVYHYKSWFTAPLTNQKAFNLNDLSYLSGYTEVMPIVPEFLVRWSKVHYEQVSLKNRHFKPKMGHEIGSNYDSVILESFLGESHFKVESF